jgi:orotidine-5'-phosphate decarboxylase
MEKKRTGLILAYDRTTCTAADRQLLKNLVPYAQMVKLGSLAMTTELWEWPHKGASVATVVRNFLQDTGEFPIPVPIMWDIKLNDTLDTVAKSLESIASHPGIKYITLHASVCDITLNIAVEVCQKRGISPVAVTVLSDMEEADCRSSYGNTIEKTVLRFAEKAYLRGIETIVCSPRELQYLSKAGLLAHLTTIVVGTRSEGVPHNDQKRVMTPRDTMNAGADYIVVGREVFLAKKPLFEIHRISEVLDRA